MDMPDFPPSLRGSIELWQEDPEAWHAEWGRKHHAFVRLLEERDALLTAARRMVAALDETKYDVFIGSPADLLRLADGRRDLINAIAKGEGRSEWETTSIAENRGDVRGTESSGDAPV